MVTIKAGGISLLVREEVAPLFKGFCDELVQRGYPLADVADDWGFACRPIRGTENRPKEKGGPVPSNHSWGLAIDLNATKNPMGSELVTDLPPWAVRLGEEKYGLSWGGRYKSNPDAMHWGFLGTPEEARWLVASLAALPASEQPPEPPLQETFSMKLFAISDGPLRASVWLLRSDGTAEHVPDVPTLERLEQLFGKYEVVTGTVWDVMAK